MDNQPSAGALISATTLPPFIDFSDALKLLQEGKKIARYGWNGKGLFITLQTPDEHSKMTSPYVYITTPGKGIDPIDQRVPWICSQIDLLAKDWFEVK